MQKMNLKPTAMPTDRPTARNSAAMVPLVGNQALLRRLQGKRSSGALRDPLEYKANAVAGQVDSEQSLRAKPDRSVPDGAAAPASVQEALSAPALPLAPAVRGFFEPRFGADFSRVQIHSGETAARSAQEVGARAYAVGNHVVFGAGQFSPSSRSGQKLLAHELAHVMQQPAAPRRDHPITVEPSASGREAAARQAAQSALGGRPPSLARLGQASPVLFREEVPAPALEVVTPEQAKGMNLPTASKQATDPRTLSDYIDNKVTSVGYGIYVGGFLVFCEGMQYPFLVPESQVDFGGATYDSTSSQVFQDRDTAVKALPYGPFPAGQALPYTYFRAPKSSIIAPTIFSKVTAPRIVRTSQEAVQKLSQEVVHELTKLAIGLGIGALIPVVSAGIQRLVDARLSATEAGVAAEAKAAEAGAGTAKPAKSGSGSNTTAPTVLAPLRPRASIQKLRQMIASREEYFVWRTKNPDIVANKTIKHTGETTPVSTAEHAGVSDPPPAGVYLSKGLKGLNYGDYCVAIKPGRFHIQNTPDPMEYVLMDEIPANEGIWYTVQDYEAAAAGLK